jgi:NAD(P)-dependent dehydrogenase (short-subunit alcohol dehydrogenase family)
MRHTPHPAGRRALVTGCAGFLGSHLSERLVDDGWQVVGVDCLTDYYPSEVKLRNLSRLLDEPAFRWHERDLAEVNLASLLDGVDTVFHLAAQAGVRGSFGKTFEAYVRDNVVAHSGCSKRSCAPTRGRSCTRRPRRSTATPSAAPRPRARRGARSRRTG